VTSVVGRLRTSLLQRDELIAEIDERHRLVLFPQLEIEQAAVENQRRFDVADLERDVIDSDVA